MSTLFLILDNGSTMDTVEKLDFDSVVCSKDNDFHIPS